MTRNQWANPFILQGENWNRGQLTHRSDLPQVQGLSPPSLTPLQLPTVRLRGSSGLLINQLQIRSAHISHLRFNHLLDGSQENSLLTRLPVYYKRIQLKSTRWKRCLGQGVRKRERSSHAFSRYAALSVPPSLLQLGISSYPFLLGFHRHNWLHHWPLVIN